MESKSPWSRRGLQIAIAVAACVPVSAGLAGAIWGLGLFGDTGAAALNADSNYRYLSGLLLGIGIAFWSTIPRIECETKTFRALAFPVVIGGFARLAALLSYGFGNWRTVIVFALAMELLVTPGLVLWQASVGASHRRPDAMGR